MLGVYSDDEMTDLAENARFARATSVNRIGGAVQNPLDDDTPAPSKMRGHTVATGEADHIVDKDGVILKDKNGEFAARDKKLLDDTEARIAEIAKTRAAEAARKADDDAKAAQAKRDAEAAAIQAKYAEEKAARAAEDKRIADEARASVADRRAAAADARSASEREIDDDERAEEKERRADDRMRKSEPATADKGGGAEAPQVSREHDAAPPDKPTEAQLSKAAEDGARAYAKGLPKRAAPAPYREPGAEDLMAAWTGSYDKAKQADMGG